MDVTKKRMVIRSSLVAHNSASNHPIGTTIPLGCTTSYPRGGGWNTLVEFQKDRMLHHLGHHAEFAVPIPLGVRIIERFGSYGFKRVTEVTFED